MGGGTSPRGKGSVKLASVAAGVPQLTPGAVIGSDFQISQQIAAGGMGAVYSALQLSTNKQRAVKVMHPSLIADPGLRERFAQEARVGAMIASDHVVEVAAAGIDPQFGVPFLAMELLSGEDLASLVQRRGALPSVELAYIMRGLCHALAAAHRAGIVHRDVKPENVFLAATQSTTQATTVKVLDFGIAKVAAQARQTATAAMGTPLWMAPEQSELGHNISPATDVWPLGLIAFWLLTGRHYWRAANAENASMPALMREILFEPLVPASQRASELGVAGAVPEHFDAWFGGCVHRDPAQRFPEAGAALAKLLELLGEPPMATLPPSALSAPSWSVPPLAPAGTLASQGVQGATQPLQQAATHPPITSSKQSAPSKGRGVSIALAAVGLLLALAGVAGAAIGLYFGVIKPEDDKSKPPTLTSAPIPSAEPVVEKHGPPPDEPEPPTSASAVPSAAPSAVAKVPRSPARPQAPALKPFDHASANAQIQRVVKSAQFACKYRKGPPAVAATLVFRPKSGTPYLQMDYKVRRTSRGMCVSTRLRTVNVAPFSGSPQKISTAVSF